MPKPDALEKTPILVADNSGKQLTGNAISEADLREARAFFADTIKKETAQLPTLKFDIETEGNEEHKTYVLKQKRPDGDITTITEMGKFHLDDDGSRKTMLRESAMSADNTPLMREIDVTSDARSGLVTTEIYEGAKSLNGVQEFEEKSKRIMKNGSEIFSSTFGEFKKGGGDNREYVTTHNEDGSVVSEIYKGEPGSSNLLCESRKTTFKNGNTESMIFTDVFDKNQKIIGKHEVREKFDNASGTSTRTNFEGPSEQSMKATDMTVTDRAGKIKERYVSNGNGELLQVKK